MKSQKQNKNDPGKSNSHAFIHRSRQQCSSENDTSFIQRACKHCSSEHGLSEAKPFISPEHLNSVQTKLVVGEPDDPFEREADQMAERVVNDSPAAITPTRLQTTVQPTVQRLCNDCDEEAEQQEEEEREDMDVPQSSMLVQRQAVDEAASQSSTRLADRLQNRSGRGEVLPPPTLAQMEGAFGRDLSHVRIHRDIEAAEMCRELNAYAFTHGSDIYFDQGRYDPTSIQGKKLLGHELTHVLQQTSPASLPSSAHQARTLTTESTLVQRDGPPRPSESPFQVRRMEEFDDFLNWEIRTVGRDLDSSLWVQSGDAGQAFQFSVTGGSTNYQYLPGIGPALGSDVEAGVYRFKYVTESTLSERGRIERLHRTIGQHWGWRDTDYWNPMAHTRLGYFAPARYFVKALSGRIEAPDPEPLPIRARDRVPNWAWQQWAAASALLRTRRATLSEDDQAAARRLPGRLTIIPGPAVLVRTHDDQRIGNSLLQNPEETGEILLNRAVNLIASLAIPSDRESVEGLPHQAPDWARQNLRWVRRRIEQDRQRYQDLAEMEASQMQRPGDEVESQSAEVERRISERRRLMESAVGLPSSMRVVHRRTSDTYALRLQRDERHTLLLMDSREDPLRLYTRVLAAGRRLSARQESPSTSSDLVRGQDEPWPVRIENIGTALAVSEHAHWFTVHVDPPTDIHLMPTLAASWHIIPVQVSGERATLGRGIRSEADDVAEDEMIASLQERPRAFMEDANIANAGVVARGEGLGAIGDVVGFGMDYLSESVGADKGIVFPEPGRYIVHVTVFPRISREDAQHYGVEAENVPAPSVAVFPISVEASGVRAGAVAEQGESADVEGAVPELRARIADLQQQIDEGGTEAELDALREQLEAASRRLHFLELQTNQFGFLTRQQRSVRQQLDTIRPLIYYLDSRNEHQPIDRATMSDTVGQLWDAMQEQWQQQITAGRRVGSFENWVQRVYRQLQQSSDAYTRQRSAVGEHDMHSARRMPGAFIAQDGRQLSLVLAVREQYNEGSNRTTVTILDVSEVGAPDSGSRAREFHGIATGNDNEARRTAFEAVVDEYVENCGYGRGALLLRRPQFWGDDLGLPDQWLRQRHPGPSERWEERLQNIATAAALAALVVSGPIGIALGVVGAAASAGAAIVRLERRLSQGTLEFDSDSFSAAIDIISAPLAGVTALGALRRGGFMVIESARLRQVVRTAEGLERVVGAVQIGHQFVVIPMQLQADIERLQGLSQHERRRVLMELWLGYAQQFHGLAMSINGVLSPEHDIDPDAPGYTTRPAPRPETPEVLPGRGRRAAEEAQSDRLPDGAEEPRSRDAESGSDTEMLNADHLRSMLEQGLLGRRRDTDPEESDPGSARPRRTETDSDSDRIPEPRSPESEDDAIPEADSTTSFHPDAEGIVPDPAGLVHLDLDAAEAEERMTIVVDEYPDREVGIWENLDTGEHIVVQGTGDGELVGPDGLPTGPHIPVDWFGDPDVGNRFRLVEHYHPGDDLGARFASGSDFRHIRYGQQSGAEPVADLSSRIRWRDPLSGEFVITEFGYIAEAGLYWIKYQDTDGHWQFHISADEPWRPGSGYEQLLAANGIHNTGTDTGPGSVSPRQATAVDESSWTEATIAETEATTELADDASTTSATAEVHSPAHATGADVTVPLYASDGRFVDSVLEAAYQRYRQPPQDGQLDRENWISYVGGSAILEGRLEAALGPGWRERRRTGGVAHSATFAGPTATWEIPQGRRRQRMEEIAMWREAFRRLRDAYPPSSDPRGARMAPTERETALARLQELIEAVHRRDLRPDEWREFDRLDRRLRRDRFLRPTLSGITHGTEQIGALAGDQFIRETTGANRIYPTHITEAGTPGTVDGLYMQRDSESTVDIDHDTYFVAEFKGNTSQLGGRVIDGAFYRQGHPRYLLATLNDMHRAGQLDTRTYRRILEAWRDGRLHYLEIRTPVPEGSHPDISLIESRAFEIPLPSDVNARIEALIIQESSDTDTE